MNAQEFLRLIISSLVQNVDAVTIEEKHDEL